MNQIIFHRVANYISNCCYPEFVPKNLQLISLIVIFLHSPVQLNSSLVY
jgi:hypothetical protein